MARKKNLKPGVYVNVTDDINDIAYTGTVNVKILKKDQVYSSRTFKNSGRWPLFYFLAGCLAGDYLTMETFRPKYIDLFNITKDGGTSVPEINSTTNLSDYFNTDERVSTNTYPYSSQPDISRKFDGANESEGVGIGEASATFKFMIPFTQLQSEGGVIKDIKAVCLYCDYNKSNFPNPSAFFFVVDPDDPTTLTSLIENANEFNSAYINEYSLYIE